ncbi:MAG: IS66 family transposase [Bacteroidales bacterium]
MKKVEKEPIAQTPEQEIARLKTALLQRDALLQVKDEKIEKLTHELLYLRRQLFGRSSERFIPQDPNQLLLAFEGQTELPQEQEAQQEPQAEVTVSYTRTAVPRKQPVREAIPEHLPRIEQVIEPAHIPQGAVRIGEEVTEKMEYIPGKVVVRRIVRPKYALPQGEGVLIAELPTQVLPKANAGASLLSHLLVSKYQDHLPFHRQLEIFKREKIPLAASTVNGWFFATTDLLMPLYEALKKEILGSDYIQVDETTIPVVDQDKPGATRKGYHWIVKSPVQNQLFFHYQKGSRAQYVVVELLRDFHGAVQSDGYGAYNVYENKQGVLLLGCMSHARRKFESALKEEPQGAGYALLVMQQLYAIERQAQEETLTPDQIKALRQQKAYPILQGFEKWLVETHAKTLPKSLMGQAIAYTYNIYPRLARYVLDGRYQIDNNGAERGVKALALGRKNYMFCGNDEAARHTAIIYSLLGSCRLAGINPTQWLTDVLERMPDHSIQKLHELLPAHWQPHQRNTPAILTQYSLSS